MASSENVPNFYYFFDLDNNKQGPYTKHEVVQRQNEFNMMGI